MTDLVDLDARLANLRALRAKGVRIVEYGEQRVEYRSDAELAAAIADLERQISATSGNPVRMVRFASSKGL